MINIHKLAFANETPPPLSRNDGDAIVWAGRTGRPAVIARRLGEWGWLRIEDLACYRFPLRSDDMSVNCVAYPDSPSNRGVVVDAYYRSVVPLALQVYGLESMHGAAVETSAGALVLCARSHTGKSTLTYSLSARGMRVLADDGVVIDVGDKGDPGSRPTLQPIPFALMLRAPSATHFGVSDRQRVFIGDDHRPTAPTPIPLAAVVLLDRVESGEAVPITATLLSPREALMGLLKHLYTFSFEQRSRTGRMMAAYIRFADKVPVFRLTYPSGMEHLEAVVDRLERAAGAHDGPVPSELALA